MKVFNKIYYTTDNKFLLKTNRGLKTQKKYEQPFIE